MMLRINSHIYFGQYDYRKEAEHGIENRNIQNFHLLGYDLLERNIKCLKNGSVRFLIAQQPIRLGHDSVEELSRHLIFKKEVKPMNFMPIDLLTSDNIDYYSDVLEK